MFCSHCGTKNDDDAKFCSSCGTSAAELTIAKATPPTKSVVRSQTYGGKTIREWSDGSSSFDGVEYRTFLTESSAKAHVDAIVHASLAKDLPISPMNVAKKSFVQEYSKALVIVGVLAVALGAILLNKPGDSATVKKAKETILSSLRDPSSAEFRNIIEAPEDFVCGEVNAKNAFGAYIGFAAFTYDGFTEKTCFDCAELDQSVCTNKVGGRVLRQERYLEGLRRMSGTVTADWLKKSLEKESIPLIAIAEKTLLEIRKKYPSPSTSASTSPAVAPSEAPTQAAATKPAVVPSAEGSYTNGKLTINVDVNAIGGSEISSSACKGTVLYPTYDSQTGMLKDPTGTYAIGFGDNYIHMDVESSNSCLPEGRYRKIK